MQKLLIALLCGVAACGDSRGKRALSTDMDPSSAPASNLPSPGAGVAAPAATVPSPVDPREVPLPPTLEVATPQGEGGAGGSDSYVPPLGGRTRLPINTEWRFLGSDAAAASATVFDDAAWTGVALPHTYNAIDGQDGGNNYYRGVAWYRKHHVLAPEAAGKKVYLEFDGVNSVCDVFVNGSAMGQHRGGFARFRFDVTRAMVPGGDNVIAVRVNNARAADIAPLDADFTSFGGLYRDVHLIVTDPLHIDVQDFASPGVYFDVTDVSAASARLRARTRVRNDFDERREVLATTVVVRVDGSVAARLSVAATVEPGTTVELAATGELTEPHLWDGLADPYVYTAHIELSSGGQLVDSVAQPLGVRSFAVDASTGFSLNGKYLDLHGVNRHQDRLGMGWALSEREHDEDMALIQEIGATAIRLAHYQHAQYFYDLADRTGMVVWAEIPLVNAISTSAAFTDNARQQLTELIRQNYNHPGIVFWSIGNEQRADDAATNALLDELDSVVHSEDPYRLSTYAQCCTSDTGGLPQHTDTVGYNTYYGWYDAFGTNAQFAAWADGLHAAQPSWKLAVSEYGAGAALSQHADNPAQPEPYGLFHPEEWQNVLHEAHWLALKTRPYLWGKFIWNMFDFAVDSRNEGDTPGRNDKGLVSYDRKTRKDAFYWYKANWSAEPFVYITSRRYTPRPATPTTIKVYANVSAVELRVNGVSRGSTTSPDHIFTWPNVALAAGPNSIEAIGTTNTETFTDGVTWMR
ncbi:MAG: glycoside hydrolase family 2 TIM barrel-domain containing protein [Deltaproteobacteria bacterium]